MKTKLKFNLVAPMSDRVFVHVLDPEEVTEGGIIIPDNTRSNEEAAMVEAEVMAVGEIAHMELDIFPKVGDYVLITRYGGTMYKQASGDNWRVLRGDDIIATLEIDNG